MIFFRASHSDFDESATADDTQQRATALSEMGEMVSAGGHYPEHGLKGESVTREDIRS